MVAAEFEDVGVRSMARKPVWQDPYSIKKGMPRYRREHRTASQDINDVSRTVVAGAVTIGTLGLIGNLFNK
jgi:hypothetical protein